MIKLNLTQEDFRERDKLVSEGYLAKAIYKELVIYNYTDKTQYTRFWNEHTLTSRGSIYYQNGKLLSASFPKFFNLGESPDSDKSLIWNESFLVFEKLDGILGITYKYEDQIRVSTRGCFKSIYTDRANDILSKHNLDLPDGINLLFEIIHPENRIVIDYGNDKNLILLGAYKNGVELDWNKVVEIANQFNFKLPKVYQYTYEELLKNRELIDYEGWVIRFKDNTRIKIKGIHYLNTYKIIKKITPKNVWRAITDNTIDQFVANVPEEFRSIVEKYIDIIQQQYKSLYQICHNYKNTLDLKPLENKKESAYKIIHKTPKWTQKYLFSIICNMQNEKLLYDLIKPSENKWVDINAYRL